MGRNAFDFLRDLKKLNAEMGSVINQTAVESAPAMALALREQLYQGYDGTGTKIGDNNPYRSEMYAEEKNAMNPAPGFGNPDLYYTGSFSRKIEVKVNGDAFITNSTDEKAELLQYKYGDEIYSLAGDFKTGVINNYMRPDIQDRITKYIKLNFRNGK